MIPLLAKLLGGRWLGGGHRRDSIESILGDAITVSWHIEDVQDVRPDLTVEQAREVLSQCRDHHDASIGINWDVLEFWANDLFPTCEEVSS